MRKLIAIVLTAVLLVSTVIAIHDAGYGGYGGQTARERRLTDPYSRVQYFGEGYSWPFVNFGQKGPNYRLINTGAKGAYSGVFNLDTNSYVNRGRDPAKISNWDPNMRGQSRLDVYVDLLPFEVVDLQKADQLVYSKGTARILSQGNAYGIGLNDPEPQGRVQIQAKDLLPLNENQIYEAWLLDEDTGYSLSLGLLKSGIQGTSQLMFEIKRMIDMFDYVMITIEPYPDLDPGPSGEVILFGIIDKPRIATRPLGSTFALRAR